MLHLVRAFGFSVGSALLATVIYPLITSVAKSLANGGSNDKLKEQMKQAYAEDSGKFENLVAEVKGEKEKI